MLVLQKQKLLYELHILYLWNSIIKGMTHLHGYQIDIGGISSKKFSILLRPPEPQMRTFSFCAENETDKRR